MTTPVVSDPNPNPMKFISPLAARSMALVGGVALGLLAPSYPVCFGQTPPGAASQATAGEVSGTGLPKAADDALKLTKAGMGEDIILGQLKGVPAVMLTTDQLILLGHEGVSQNVIKALLQGSPTAAPVSSGVGPVVAAAAVTAFYSQTPPLPLAGSPASPEVSPEYVRNQLAPYGSWIEIPGYGLCWSPSVAAQDPSWRPYADQGQWVYTDGGLFWQSGYPWGDIAFHYGRWAHAGRFGWIWTPGSDWAPAWVAWRHGEAEGYIGWAPLPPSAQFVAGVGLMFNGSVALDVDFGLGADAFVFVGADRFWEHDYRGFFLGRERAEYFYRHSVVRNGYRFEGGRFIVEGMGRDRLGVYTRHDVRLEQARDIRAREEAIHFDARRTDPRLSPEQRSRILQGRPFTLTKQDPRSDGKPTPKPDDRQQR